MLKILFDHCTPAPLRNALRARGHQVTTCYELSWNHKPDAALLAMAEEKDLTYSSPQIKIFVINKILLKERYPFSC